jgi:hypothetical protein
MWYRLLAQPANRTRSEDVLVEEFDGHIYLLDRGERRLVPVDQNEASVLLSFYDRSQDISWHTDAELMRLLGPVPAGEEPAAPLAHSCA